MIELANAILELTGHTALSAATAYAIVFIAIYLMCFAGGLVKDLIMAHKFHSKVDIIDLILYPVSCAVIIVAAIDLLHSRSIHTSVSVAVFVSVLAGTWSREIVACLLNNKLMFSVAKLSTKMAINRIGWLSKKEKDSLQEALISGVKDAMDDEEELRKVEELQRSMNPDNELSGEREPVGEYEWLEILEGGDKK